MKTILAIESSCDDTSAAIIKGGKILSNITATQTVHEKYGGVVPELASRKHMLNIIPVVDQSLKKAGIDKKELDAIAFTRGPGLLGSLIVGVSFAKSLALSLNIPMIEINHMQAHVLAHFAEPPFPTFPFLCLTVSGGHTQIINVSDYDEMEILGSSIDDAAGEAFDKTGKILGLPYPAGPEIDKRAKLGTPIYEFPEPKVGKYEFSFSGLKTSILYFLRKQVKEDPQFVNKNMNDICASVQHRIVTILINKITAASEEFGIKNIAIAGGVSANSGLRQALSEAGEKNEWNVFIPDFQYCTDNAGMIAVAAQYKYEKKDFVDQSITPSPRLKI